MNSLDSKPAAPVGHHATILCVDDEPNILAALRRLFRSHSYHILTAESGSAGLDMMEAHQVDIVISDMRMPRMHGVEFLVSVRLRWPNSIRLLLTGHADVQMIHDAITHGEIFRYLTKPWNEKELLEAVHEAYCVSNQGQSVTKNDVE